MQAATIGYYNHTKLCCVPLVSSEEMTWKRSTYIVLVHGEMALKNVKFL